MFWLLSIQLFKWNQCKSFKFGKLNKYTLIVICVWAHNSHCSSISPSKDHSHCSFISPSRVHSQCSSISLSKDHSHCSSNSLSKDYSHCSSISLSKDHSHCSFISLSKGHSQCSLISLSKNLSHCSSISISLWQHSNWTLYRDHSNFNSSWCFQPKVRFNCLSDWSNWQVLRSMCSIWHCTTKW